MAERPRSAIVVGNGVVGLSVAIALQQRGVATTIVAPDADWRGASWGNAGHIAVEQVAPLASRATLRSLPARLFSRGGALALPPRDVATWLPFGLNLLRASAPDRFEAGKTALSALLATAMPAWRRLLDTSGRGDLLREDGHIVVWETPDSAARGRAAWGDSDIGTASLHDLTADELAAVAARVSVPLAGGVRFSGSGQIADPAALGEALAAIFARLGGRRRSGRAAMLTPTQSGARVTLDGGGALDADVAVVAAGAASAPLLTPLGHHVPLIAERGYHLEAAPADWPRGLPPVVFEDRSMILTRFSGALRAASFVEFSTAGRAPDPRKWARLQGHLDALGIPFVEAPRPWMGARPTLPDYLPAIGRSHRHGAIAYAFGHQHLGLTLAATTGELLASYLTDGKSHIDLSPYDVARFGR
ncbi:FAD-binding oxidoreductase [uncultured Sphingomonas sp.]|uniref:NAD(P)/FAD-dependent oxidoreductase n=1 Tax=uncultured Sphingomonas sp. TaxID=158754 RepID=UPI0025E4A1B6|nr:FAD-binding oxidoreductase [uncultured Sphingomonas sp.]